MRHFASRHPARIAPNNSAPLARQSRDDIPSPSASARKAPSFLGRFVAAVRAGRRRLARLAAWLISAQRWDWLFDRQPAPARQWPPRVLLCLEGLEERTLPS